MIKYEANDIVSLSPGRAFREKVGMYLSADRQEAINLGLRELIVNIQDEYEVFKPKNPLCKITLNTKEKIITVKDNMRGIPVGIREDGINSLTAAFLIPHSGGKHIEGVYSSAVGVNGEGNKIVCHTAKWLNVLVFREGKIYSQKFQSNEEGAAPITGVSVVGSTEKTGTIIEYNPDIMVYGDVFIDIEELRAMLREMSFFTRGLQITLEVDGIKEEFLSKNGLIDGLQNKNSLSKPFSYFYELDGCQVELALQWVSAKGNIRGYANGLYMPDGGAFISGFKSSLTRTFNNLANSKYSGDTIRDVLDGFVSVKVKVGQFSNQAKTALANPEARTATSTATTNALKDFAQKRKGDFEKVIELLQKIEKAEQAADRARRQVLEATKDIEKNQKKKVFASDKLKDAEYLGEKSTLLAVEGLSAGASITNARTPNFGVLMLKGKPLNVLTADEEKIYQNEEIKLLLSAMNIIPGRYDAKKLRYGKLGICSDFDVDGGHIALLITTALQYFCPEFIKEGRLVRLWSPLWIVKNKKQEYYFYNEKDINIKGEKHLCKGLGSLSPEQARRAMFTDEFQFLEEVKLSSSDISLLNELMGKDSAPKKEFVFKNIDFSIVRE